MKLVNLAGGARWLLRICNPRWAYDFDAPGLPLRVQLERLHLALSMARRRCIDPHSDPELAYALSDCQTLMARPLLDVEEIRRERVDHRIARIKRVLAHHEGTVERLNRRYWWMPFSLLLFIMAVCLFPDLLSLFI